jgi:hypothetical protein
VLTATYAIFEFARWHYGEVPVDVYRTLPFFRLGNGPLGLAVFIVQAIFYYGFVHNFFLRIFVFKYFWLDLGSCRFSTSFSGRRDALANCAHSIGAIHTESGNHKSLLFG